MHTKPLLFALLLTTGAISAQETTTPPETPRQQTLLSHSRLRGGFGGPIFSWHNTKGQLGYGAGGGGGVTFDQGFFGFFGMGETFDNPLVGKKHLSLGYGGVWLGANIPSGKLLHLYASAKVGWGSVGVAYYDDWEFDDNWDDLVFVAVPEAGLELNITRWMRLSGSIGYRFVNGFDGWENYGKKDLNAVNYSLTVRFGKFGK